jgi:hypothetical protein
MRVTGEVASAGDVQVDGVPDLPAVAAKSA